MLRMLSRAHRSQVHTRSPRSTATDQPTGAQSPGAAVPQLAHVTCGVVDVTRSG